MGDRSNVKILSGSGNVNFYSHWGGARHIKAALEGIKRAHEHGRLFCDEEYSFGIIVASIVKRQLEANPDYPEKSGTGFGVSVKPRSDLNQYSDNEYPVLHIDLKKNVLFWRDEDDEPLGEPIPFVNVVDGEVSPVQPLWKPGEDKEDAWWEGCNPWNPRGFVVKQRAAA